MGLFTRLLLIGLSLGSAYIAYQIFSEPEVPKIDPDQYWGPSALKSQKEDTSVRPFKVNVDEKVLTDLKNRLKLELTTGNRLTKPYEGIGFEYGFNTEYLKTVGQHWLDKYDWRQREKLINKYPHFKTKVEGLDIHFQHVKSSNNKNYKITRPLLLLHGWPGSFIEFQKIVPLLIDPKDSDINFELVIPSLPGYGFFEGGARPGLGTVEMGQIFIKLMQRLGHNKFYAQGGDWGAIIVTNMAATNPQNVMGIHENMCSAHGAVHILRRIIASFYPQMFMSAEEEEESYPFAKYFKLMLRETGYSHIQNTKPDTVGVGLSNSPLGLATYILEKFSGWTNLNEISKPDGGLPSTFKLDELLDNIMIYWVTNSITTSVRLYAEIFNPTSTGVGSVPVKVPTACFAPRHEFFDMPEFFLPGKFPQLKRYTRGTKGGHFTAFEIPDILAKDIVESFSLFEKSNFTKFNQK